MKKIIYPIIFSTLFVLSCSKDDPVIPPEPEDPYKTVKAAVPNKLKAYAIDIETKDYVNLPSHFHDASGRDFGSGFPKGGYTIDIQEGSATRTGEFSSGTVKYTMPYTFNSDNFGSSSGTLEVILKSIGTKTISSSWKVNSSKESNN